MEEYLSMLFSYIDNVEVVYEGVDIELREQEVKVRPTLIFEKVDVDHTLYLRLVTFRWQPRHTTDGVQKSQLVMLQALSELRRIASVPESLSDGMITSPKLSQLIDAVMDAVENGHKVVVFFNFIA